ncbi:MAG TPA: VWA domain-containing protein, partial [Pyrinomonadaceae bacterium]|nr:VWA domain-containing protein [Pyrinomonadaceae bacterium]
MSGITSNAISMTPDANANSLRDVGNEIDTYREEVFSVGTLGALNYVVKGLKELPGRKSAILFSDGISILRRDGKSRNVLESMRRLVDLANRASVVVYTMDARGLQTLGLTAQDNIGGRNSAQQIRSEIDDRSASYFESKNGLNYLAQQTGGLFIENTNDIAEGVRTVLDDQKGFYLIGYRPSESTFDAKTGGRKFYQLDVRVKRPGLKVRTRNGFYGIPETEARAARGTRQEQLYGALSSPFASGDVRVRLTSLYANDPQSGAFMRSLVHVDAKDLTFKEESNGARKCDVDVLALTFGDTGEPLDDYNATLTWTGDARAYENVLQSGLLYIVNVPIKRPGPYQLRLAVRDKATERTGSASQFIEVPDLGKGRLTLSGLILSGDDITAEAVPASASTANASAAAVASSNAGANGVAPRASGDPQAGPALRRLRPGMELFYNFAVYNAQLDRATSRPQLTTQVRLFRDGRELYAGKPIPVDIGAQTDMKNLFAGGRIKLSPKTAPGTYVLQVVVTDALAKDKQRTATRWIDFEIVQK